MGLPDSVVEHIHSQLSRSVEELEAFCAIPSVSTLSEHADDVRRAAEWLADRLERLGIEPFKTRVYAQRNTPAARRNLAHV